MKIVTTVYCDGGLVLGNPSEIGGTWAFLHLGEGDVPLLQKSGHVRPEAFHLPAVTNNLTEMLALVLALEALPDGWAGAVYSDSQVTLGRAFTGWSFRGLPSELVLRLQAAKRRLDWKRVGCCLLDGHPTQAQLKQGRGKRGNKCSPWNVLCDTLCREEARLLLEALKGEAL